MATDRRECGALAGADSADSDRLLGPLSARDVKKFRQRMQKLEPILLSDIERAQQLVAALAARLTDQKTVTMSPERRLAALA